MRLNKLFSVSARLQPQNRVCVSSQKHPARFLSTKILLKVISLSTNQQTELLQNTPTGQTDETWQNIITNTVQHNAFLTELFKPNPCDNSTTVHTVYLKCHTLLK